MIGKKQTIVVQKQKFFEEQEFGLQKTETKLRFGNAQILGQDFGQLGQSFEQTTKQIRQTIAVLILKSEVKSFAKFVGLFAIAVSGRVALQYVPSVEPIIPLAIIAGLMFGAKEGFSLGAGAYVASNFFVWGLQGPWTLFQALGAGIPGFAAGLFGKFKKPNSNDVVLLSIAGTVFFEALMNLSGSFFGIGLFLGILNLPLYFLTSLPFSATHIVSNIVFAKGFGGIFIGGKKDEKIITVPAVGRNSRN
ncbi:MAG: hypothetical protein Q7K42_03890 [Candidatus Diapherotrites archaeon]|nr:hypothetical protein [Candidatus Diapherotrites archaeon]